MKPMTPSEHASIAASRRAGPLDRLLRQRLFASLAALDHGQLLIEDSLGSVTLGRGDPCVRLTVSDLGFYRLVAAQGSVGAGEAYGDGLWRCDDLVGLVRLLVRNRDTLDAMESGLARLAGWALRRWHAGNANTRAGSRRNIAAHYDLGNTFFGLFLSDDLMYSSAMWADGDDTLEAASHRKLETICRKLELQPTDRVVEIGSNVRSRQIGQRVGVGWIHRSSGDERENLSPQFRATGRDVDGGYAEYMTVPADYAYPIPDCFSDAVAAPLLCAGAVGYRALRLANLSPAGRLGLTGFGGSGHLVLQLARHLYPAAEVYVFARDDQTRQFARTLGADWAGEAAEPTPHLLDAVIDTTPAWRPVVEGIRHLAPGGRLVINAIDKLNDDKPELLRLDYQSCLWMEREIKSVANITRADIAEFLPIAAAAGIRPTVQIYPLAEANRALVELNAGQVRGAKVLQVR